MDKVIGVRHRVNLLGATVDAITQKQTVELVDEYIRLKEPLHLIGVNADKVNMMRRNPDFLALVNECGIINADGASLVLASKVLGEALPERVAGIDLMGALVRNAAHKGYRVFLLGAKETVVQKTAKALLDSNPSLKIAGLQDGYFKKKEWSLIYERMASTKPDIVFVGITSPMKEQLVTFFQHKGSDAVFMGVGGSFDVISGEIARAPKWMQNCNLEWLFRVIKEPRRLFKRYLVGNGKFIWTVILERLRRWF